MMRALLAAVALALVACGPVQYMRNVIAAEAAVEAARAANARWHAPYEFYSAEAFLNKAREQSAEAEYEDAIRFADAAASYGERALELARARAQEAR